MSDLETATEVDEQVAVPDADGDVAGTETSDVTHTASIDDAPTGDVIDDEASAGSGDAEQPRSNRGQQLEAEGDIAADYLEELLDIADLDGDIDTYVEGGRAHVSIVTEGDLLVGREGEVLEALQELARLAVMTETGHRSRLMLDVAGYRERQRKELRALALEAIEEVRQTGEATALAPMNPFERKIVHDAVAEAGLNSESEGVEPRRHVVVLPA